MLIFSEECVWVNTLNPRCDVGKRDSAICYWHQLGDWSISPGNNQLVAIFYLFQEPRKMGLGFMNADYFGHETNLLVSLSQAKTSFDICGQVSSSRKGSWSQGHRQNN